MSTPVVVQGTPVAAPGHYTTPQGGTNIAHEHQPAQTKCNDPFFAFLLYGNLAAIAAVAVIYGPGSFNSAESNSGFDYTG
jgi:hypothetical protein